MAKFRKTTAKTLAAHLRALAAYVEQDDAGRKELAEQFNAWIDELLGDDYFGTEGQCDPRGDHRR